MKTRFSINVRKPSVENFLNARKGGPSKKIDDCYFIGDLREWLSTEGSSEGDLGSFKQALKESFQLTEKCCGDFTRFLTRFTLRDLFLNQVR